jgi:hypothetical protein
MGIKEGLEGLERKLGQQPWYVWAGAVSGAGVLGWLILKKRAAAAAAQSQQGYVTPGADQAALDAALNGVQLGNMAGVPYGYQNSEGPVDNFPMPTPTPTSTPTSTTSGNSSNGSSSTSGNSSNGSSSNTIVQTNTNSTGGTGQQDPNPYAGLLGPRVKIEDWNKRTYTSPTVKNPTHIPIPDNDPLTAGGEGRVWYVDNGIQHLLTDGTGAPVTNSGFPVNSPKNTPAGIGGGGYGSFHEPVNQIRNTVWDLTSVGIGHADMGWDL